MTQSLGGPPNIPRTCVHNGMSNKPPNGWPDKTRRKFHGSSPFAAAEFLVGLQTHLQEDRIRCGVPEDVAC